MLRETAMRSSEPLKHARWGDINWARSVLQLVDSKTGAREVPLSPAALQVLRDLGPGQAHEKIINITYEALRAAWGRACKRAGIENLVLHDLRRTGATRLALKTGNAFLVQALTGHKTLAMVERYINVGADDVVKVLHAVEPEPKQGVNAADAPAALVDVAPAVPLGYTQAQMQDLVQMAVNATLAGLQQATGGPDPKGAALTLVAQPEPRGRSQLRVVR